MKPSLLPTLRIIGITLMAVSITMVPAFVVSLICREWDIALVFISLAGVFFLIGFSLNSACRRNNTYNKPFRIADGLLIVILCWISASIVGATPYLLSGSHISFIDAFFESCSGYTTTGATLFTEVNHLPRGLLFWRSMTCWAGGLGIMIIGIALMPALGLNGQRITLIDNHGPTLERITSKMIGTMRTILFIYLSITLIETVLLTLGGMTIFNGLLHSMSTVSTGGFSRYDDSIGHFDSNYIRTVILIFMILSGISFDLYVRSVREGLRAFANNTELKVYGVIILFSCFVITTFLLINDTYESSAETVSISLFQTVSILTTTGFTTTDYRFWPVVCQLILIVLMFTGACSSSPGGGVKVVRVAVALKLIRHGITMRLHPNFIESVKLNKQVLPGDKVSGAVTLPFLFMTALFLGALLMTLAGNPMPESFSAGLSCLCNTGNGFGGLGADSIYTQFNSFSKLTLTALMIGGRLELYAIMVMVIPKYWTKDY